MDHTAGVDRGMHPAQKLALTFGVIYTLVGIIGFFITGFDNFAGSDTNERLLWFAINPLHNVAHLLTGILGIMMAKTLAGARSYGWLLTALFAALFVYGLFALNNTDANFLSINAADNLLHLATAGVGLVMALWPATTRDTAEMRAHRTV